MRSITEFLYHIYIDQIIILSCHNIFNNDSYFYHKILGIFYEKFYILQKLRKKIKIIFSCFKFTSQTQICICVVLNTKDGVYTTNLLPKCEIKKWSKFLFDFEL